MARAELFNFGSVNIAGITATDKATPVLADKVIIIDSEDNNRLKEADLASLPGGGGSGTGWDHTEDQVSDLPAATGSGDTALITVGLTFGWNVRSGLYIDNGSWNRASNATFQVLDTEATMSDDGDNTKKMDWELSNITTGNTRTITMADRNLDLNNPIFNQITGVVTTGTAPLVIASTTKVTNLNVDLLDDQTGTYYLARANHTGTQIASTISDFDTEVSNNTNVSANTTHRSSDGSDHTFINQSVTTSASPTFAAITGSGILSIDDVTDSSSTITGSIHTDGGLGVAKSSFFGDDITITMAGAAGLNMVDTTRGTAAFVAGAEFDLKWNKTTGTAIMDFEAKADDTTSECQYRFGLSSGSTGANKIMLFDENGANIQTILASSNTNSYINRQGGNLVVGSNTVLSSAKFSVHGEIVWQPGSTVSLSNNGDFEVAATSNTSLTFFLRGTDGTTRSANLTLA